MFWIIAFNNWSVDFTCCNWMIADKNLVVNEGYLIDLTRFNERYFVLITVIMGDMNVDSWKEVWKEEQLKWYIVCQAKCRYSVKYAVCTLLYYLDCLQTRVKTIRNGPTGFTRAKDSLINVWLSISGGVERSDEFVLRNKTVTRYLRSTYRSTSISNYTRKWNNVLMQE